MKAGELQQRQRGAPWDSCRQLGPPQLHACEVFGSLRASPRRCATRALATNANGLAHELTAAGPTACTSLAVAADGTTPAASTARSTPPEEQRVTTRRGVTRATELIGGVRAEALPRQGDRGRLAQRSGVERDRRGTRAHLPLKATGPRPPRNRADDRRAASSPAAPRSAAPGTPGSATIPDRPTGNRRPTRASGPGRRD